jgi:hypothetical protein
MFVQVWRRLGVGMPDGECFSLSAQKPLPSTTAMSGSSLTTSSRRNELAFLLLM